MDFKLDKAHQLQQQLFRNFAETEIKPLAKDMDEAEAYDMDLLAKIQKCGFLGIPYAREYGGAGSDTLAYTLCMEEMSKIDASTGIMISVHQQLRHRGSEAALPAPPDRRQQGRLLRPDRARRRF